MSLCGNNYWYLVYADGAREKVRLEIAKELSIEDFKYWREKIIAILNEIDWKQQKEEASE